METKPTPPIQFLFPQELIDTLIDLIQDLRQNSNTPQDFTSTLKACSLTCKAFLPRARKHLFRELILRTNPRDHYRATDKLSFRQRVQFLLDRDHLTGLSPEVLSLVRKLTVCEGHFTWADWHTNGERHRLLPFGLLPFTALTEIELGSKHARSSYDIDGQSLSMLLRKNLSLEILHLESVAFSKTSETLSVLSSLSHHVNFHSLGLVSVHIQDALTLSRIDMPVISCVQQPRLKNLDFRDPDDRLLGVLFLNPDSIFDISGLQTLDLSTQLKPIMSQTAPEDGNYPKILSRCPGSLARLCLDVRDFLWMDVTTMDYLQDATELELLELKGLPIRHGWTQEIEFIVTLISALPAKLHCLSLHVGTLDTHLSNQFVELDLELSKTLPSSSNLKEVKIVFEQYGCTVDGETDIEPIVKWFPSLTEKKLLITTERSKRRDLYPVK
ncbi:hypothetical protein K435DRAFT_855018 [Dendrothele bispora CBS 962.96]|uniref:F-box domain-containing protein n=1 Tax=Dendrothele bispora (strain CBS 962.96) TaxID=1314807 RepID=A0A4V4HGU2_DENBC|nr:hypothetical protein K435DRAFT_855018 [Dendrothele bispora CBS 962.96]